MPKYDSLSHSNVFDNTNMEGWRSPDTVYNSYSGTDIVAQMQLPGEGPITVAELQTISYSTHRENTPVRTLGRTNPVSFVRGPRCLPASETVYVEGRGLIGIDKVKVGDMVQSSSLGFNRVLGSFDQGTKECMELTLSSGFTLKASYDHPISTSRGWVNMEDLKPGDLVHTVSAMPVSSIDLKVSDDSIIEVAKKVGDIMGRGGGSLIPARFISDLSGRQIAVFLLSLLASGGQVHKSEDGGSVICYPTGSRDRATNIATLLLKLGVRPSFCGDCGEDVTHGVHVRGVDAIKFIKRASALSGDCVPSYLVDEFSIDATSQGSGLTSLDVYNLVNEETKDEWVLESVVSVNEIGNLRVYDLEVEGRHSFVSGFMSVHNTIAGSLVFTVFDEYAFYRINRFKNAVKAGYYPLADMLPPLDISLTFSNEHGVASTLRIYGVTIIDEGQTMSIDDLITEQTYCVDDTTEALTLRGWKKYDEIQDDDILLSLDPETKSIEWVDLESVHTFDYEGEMVKWEGEGLDALTTPNHRWVTVDSSEVRGSSLYSSEAEFRTTDEVIGGDRGIVAGGGLYLGGERNTEVSAEAVQIGDLKDLDIDQLLRLRNDLGDDEGSMDVRQAVSALTGRRTSLGEDGSLVSHEGPVVDPRLLDDSEPVHYDGVVWCPKTKHGTWLARRNGSVYWTGNTFLARGIQPITKYETSKPMYPPPRAGISAYSPYFEGAMRFF